MIDVVFIEEVPDGIRLIPLVFDAVPEEQHRATAVATEDEVEEGAAITDHVRAERRSITFRAVISDTPIASNDAISVDYQSREVSIGGREVVDPATRNGGDAWQGAREEDSGRLVKISILEANGEVTRVDDAWAVIEDARARSLLAIVSTRFDTYEDAALIEFLADRTAGDGSWLRASFTFREIGFASTSLVEDPVPLRPRDRAEEDKGSQEATEAPPRLTSILSGLFG